MADREKVIDALNRCTLQGRHSRKMHQEACAACLYRRDRKCNFTALMKDALELLKEQEPKHGRWVRLTGMAPPEYHGHKICSMCESFAPYDPIHMGREILPKYCPGCGAEMEGAAE